MLADFRLAVRTLAKSRLFVVVAVSTLAIGIGADTAAFSLMDTILFRPLRFATPEGLVDVSEWSATKLCAGCGVGTSHDTYREWRTGATAFDDMGAYVEIPLSVADTAAAERISGALASASLFRTLGARARLGRLYTDDDEKPGAAPVAVLSHALWTSRFAADTGIIGRAVRINGTQRVVIGVLPADFHFPEFATAWLPLEPNIRATRRDDRSLGVVARLRGGVTVEAANAEMATRAAALAREHPETNAEWTTRVTPLRATLAGTEAQLFVILLGAVSLVLLIVCANLAGLLLARGAARRREIAVRLALGATRARIVRMLLAETTLLSLAGGVLAALMTWWAVDLVSVQFRGFVPLWMEFRVDARVLAFCALASVVAGLAFGLLPALRASDANLQDDLKTGAFAGGRSGARVRAWLVVGELSVALVLLAASGLLIKSFLRISTTAEGEDRAGLITAQMDFLDSRYETPSALLASAGDIMGRISQVPTVRAAALSRTEFLAGFGARDRKIRVEGRATIPDGVSPRFANAVTPGFFETMGMSLAAGRAFTDRDRAGSPAVIVIPDRLAQDLWPGESAIGKRLAFRDSAGAPWWTVVGVLADRTPGAERARNAATLVYVPLAQMPGRPLDLKVRGPSENPLRLVPTLRAAVSAVDRDLPLTNLMTAEQAHARVYWPYKLYALVMSSFAVLAVLLAVIGVYGIVAYGVAQRTREIGIRVALGAQRSDVIALVTGQGFRLAILGIGIGLLLSAGTLRVMRGLLFGAAPVDPLVLAAVAILIGVSASLASYVPARRAARVDPAAALRFD